MVIGATYIPGMVDPALRRLGRFDRELEIGVPDQKAMAEILRIHSRGMPLSCDVTLGKRARITHGFASADLEILCKEAGMNALRGALHSPQGNGDSRDETVEVTMADFHAAMKEVQPTARRELFDEKPSVNWSDVGGLAELKDMLWPRIRLPSP